MPTWLLNPGNVLLKKNVRQSKYEPYVEEVELLEANPSYARVKWPGGKDSNVSLRQIAPLPLTKDDESLSQEKVSDNLKTDGCNLNAPASSFQHPVNQTTSQCDRTDQPPQEIVLRRSSRIRRPPDRLEYN